eukprot:13944501-Ditylum_brightwellii.AAC.2
MLTKVPTLPHHSFVLATLLESLKGLGMHAPHRIAIASSVVPMARTIRQACQGITLTNKQKQKVSPYLHSVYRDWKTSDLPIFTAFRQLMSKAIAPLHLPDSAITSDKLT